MEPGDLPVTANSSVARCALVVSAVRFLPESLVGILGRALKMPRCEQAATLDDALELSRSTPLGVVLLDVAFPGGTRGAMRISAAAPDAKLIALWISETEEDVLGWAEAGIAGYVPNTASVDALIGLIEEISCGGRTCPSGIAGSPFRRVAASGRTLARTTPSLTRRDLEILRPVTTGLSNKDIARRLSISVGTTKSHVHNLLGKLGLQRRTEIMVRMRDGSLAAF
jgi:two-component system, NarL family, nitrate/nitrite response regulator NarL